MINLTEGELLEQNYIVMLIFASSWIFSYWLNMLPFGKDLKKY